MSRQRERAGRRAIRASVQCWGRVLLEAVFYHPLWEIVRALVADVSNPGKRIGGGRAATKDQQRDDRQAGRMAAKARGNATFGPRGLKMMTSGLSAAEVLERLLDGDYGERIRRALISLMGVENLSNRFRGTRRMIDADVLLVLRRRLQVTGDPVAEA